MFDYRTPGALALRYILVASGLMVLSACDHEPPHARPSQSPAPANAQGLEPQVPDMAPVSPDIARALRDLFRLAGVDATAQNDTVRAAGHVITARATVAGVQEAPDHTTAALDVSLSLDGVPNSAFHVAAIGIDANRTEAVQHAIRSWGVEYGMVIVDALLALGHGGSIGDSGGVSPTPTGHRAPPTPVGDWIAYAGPTGARGDVPDTWESDERILHSAFFSNMAPLVATFAPGAAGVGFHSVKVTAHVMAGSVGEADCRIDGVDSDRLCQVVRTLPWPRSDGEYIYRQFYLLTPRGR